MKRKLIITLLLLGIVAASLMLKVGITGLFSYALQSDLTTTNNYAEINLDVSDISSMQSFIWNWAGTNYTIYDESLVLMYNFDNLAVLGESDTHIFDVSGNGNNGTISGATFTSSGRHNYGLVFDGDDYVNAGNDNSLDITGDISISVWMKSDTGGPTLGGVSDYVKIGDESVGGELGAGDNFGQSIANLGDLNNDGILDLAVGANKVDDGPIEAGAMYILYLHNNGSVKSYLKINDTSLGGSLDIYDWFGYSIVNLNDLDGDGVQDIAIGSRGDDDGGENKGAIYILYMHNNGSIKSYVKINDTSVGEVLISWAGLGFSLANIGDLDNDGVVDLASGLDKYWERFSILFMNANGSVKSFIKMNISDFGLVYPSNAEFFSKSVTDIGDLNNDGILDLAVGASFANDGKYHAGAVYILFMNTNGSVKSYSKINDTSLGGGLEENDQFGTSVTDIGDLNGDGITDLAIGAHKDDDGEDNAGAVYILFMERDGSVKSYKKINTTNIGEELYINDIFGASIANIGDLDNNGVNDLVVGAKKDDNGGVDAGAIYILFMEDGPGSLVHKNDSYRLRASQTHAKGVINKSIIDYDFSFGSGWNHLVFTSDETNKYLYINGVLVSTTTSDSINSNSYNLYLGQNFSGTIDELRIYNKTLTSSEITQLYKSNLYRTSFNNWSFNSMQTGLSIGTYAYHTFVKDSSGFTRSQIRNIMIQAVTDDEPPTTSGGGIASFFPSLELLRQGYQNYLLRDQEVKMEIKGKQHTLKIIEIYKDKVTILISSEPQTFNLSIDETKEVDVDGDDKADLKVFLQEIISNKANLIITSIEDQTSDEGDNETEDLEEPKEKSLEGFLNIIVVLEGLLILVAIGLVIWFVVKRREQKAEGAKPI